MKKNKRELSKINNKIDNIENMLLDGINVIHDLLNPDIRKRLDYEELKGIVAINNSLNASIKTYLQTEIIKERLAKTNENIIEIG